MLASFVVLRNICNRQQYNDLQTNHGNIIYNPYLLNSHSNPLSLFHDVQLLQFEQRHQVTGLKLNGTNQLLVYVDNVNIWSTIYKVVQI